jgi:hypothetical protein
MQGVLFTFEGQKGVQELWDENASSWTINLHKPNYKLVNTNFRMK